MAKPTGFLEFDRELPKKRDPKERIQDYKEVDAALDTNLTQKQAARCMDCGTPFCHQGCPLGNIIPEFNDAVYQQNWPSRGSGANARSTIASPGCGRCLS